MSKIVPGVYCSTTGSPLGAAMTAAAELRGIDVMSAPLEPAPLPDGVSALLLDDFLAALMLRPDPGNAVDALPGADAMARLEELVGRGLEAGVTRIVAISAPRRPQGGLPLSVIAAAREFEALLARAGAGHAVVLRTLEVSDPMAGATQAVVRRLLRGDGFASAASDPFQGVALSDLAMAAAAAATVRDVDGRHLDIVAHQAVSRRHMAQETERLGRLLSNPDLTEVSARPSYGAEPALLDARPAALALHVAPQETAWTMLARTTQELVRYACEMGDLPPKVPPMSRVHEALETGALPLAGKHVVLSGASHPIGQAAAIMLLRLGANVTGIVRNSEAGAALAARCAEERPAWQRLRLRHARLAAQTGRCPQPCGGEAGGLQIESADLSDLTAVRALAARMHARHPRLDAVVHAGLLTLPQRRETAQGHETLFAANVLSPLMLTRLLAEPLVAAGQAGGAWVVNMVAPGHAEAPLNLDDLHSRWAYVPETVLARAASGMIMMTAALASAMAGSGVRAVAVDAGNVAGGVAEDLTRTVGAAPSTKQRLEAQQKARRQAQAGQSPSVLPTEVAAHLIEVLVSANLTEANGGYVSGGAVAAAADHAKDPQRIDALWLRCAELTGLAP